MNWELCDTKTDQNKVLLARRAAEAEIELLEKEQTLTQERKEAILAIYQANYQYSDLLIQAQERGLNTAFDTILNFMSQYNFMIEKCMQIRSAFTSEIIIKTNQLYYNLEQQVNQDTYELINKKLPELMNTLNALDKENPIYNTYKDSVEKMIQQTVDFQFKHLNHLQSQQEKLFEMNRDYMKDSFSKMEENVKKRIGIIFNQPNFTQQIESNLKLLLESKI